MKTPLLFLAALVFLTSLPPAAAQQVSITASDPWGNKAGSGDPVAFTVARTGATTSALTVNLSVSGTAIPGTDYPALAATRTIPAGQASSVITITPHSGAPNRTGTPPDIVVGLAAGAYTIDSGNASATAYIAQNGNLNLSGEDMLITMRKVTTNVGGNYELSIPQRNGVDIPVIRGVIVGAPGDGGSDPGMDFDRWCHDMQWAYLAQKFSSDTAANPINALNALAVTTGYPELQYAPICARGYSRGGGLATALAKAYPARMVAFYARGWARADWSGSAPFAPSAATAAVPGWFDTGATDGYAGVTRTAFERGRAMGALWSYSEYSGEGHGEDAMSELSREFFEACIGLRYDYQPGVAGKDPKLGPVNLTALNESAGWVGEHLYGRNRGTFSGIYSAQIPNWHRDFETRNPFVSPVSSFDRTDTGTSVYHRQHSWLPNERIARVWAQHTGMGWDSLALRFPESVPYLVNAGQPIVCTLDTGGFPEAIKAEFFVNEVKVHETSTPPFTHTYTVGTPGGHVLWARAISADGAVRITGNHRRSRLGYGNRYIRVIPADELGNTAPSIGALPTIRIRSGDTTGISIPFTIGDAETAAANLTVDSAYNRITWPFSGTATITGTGANRILTVTDSGSNIEEGTFYRGSIKVSDGFLATERGFDIEILPAAGSDAPAFVNPTSGNVTLNPADGLWSSTGTFTVTDGDTPLNQIATTFTHTNTSNLPAANIRLSAWGPVRTLRVRKVFANWDPIGMRLSLNDGTSTNQASSDVYFANVPAQAINEAPWLSTIPDQSCAQGGQTAPVLFRLGDLNWLPDELVVTATSSNPALLPDENIFITPVGNAKIDRERSLVCQPAPGQSGTAAITVRVAEPSANPVAPAGPLFATRTFILTVTAGTGPTVTITAVDPTATEAGPTVGRFTVSIPVAIAEDLPVSYTVGGTATPGADYTALPGIVTIPAGSLSADIHVTPIDDSLFEAAETVVVSLTSLPAYNLGVPAQATVTIISDDVAPPTFTPAAGTYTATQNVSISSATGGASIRYTTDGSTPTSTAGTVYSGAISVNSTTTFRAIAYQENMADSSVASASYSIVEPTPPAAPASLTATANSASQITVSWTDNSSDETGFKVERSPDGSTAWMQIATPAANVTTYIDTGRAPVTTYFYRVLATNTAGDSAYSSTASATTPKLAQTISFADIPARTIGSAPFTLTATASSGLPVNYTSSNTAVATVSGNTVTLVAVGSAIITASQSGNESYAAAPDVPRTLNVVSGITAGQLAKWEFAGATGNEATAQPSGSHLQLTITGLSRGFGLNLSGYGADLTSNSFAYQQPDGGTVSTNAATAMSLGHYTQFTVTPQAGGMVSISSLSFAPYWQNQVPTVANLGIAYSTDGTVFTIAAVTGTPSMQNGALLTADLSGVAALQNFAGAITFRLLQPNIGAYQFAGIGRYTGDDIVLMGTVTTSKLDQTITFGTLAGKNFGDPPFALDASASSGLDVIYESGNTAVATISGNVVTIVGEGSSAITASQPGNASYNAANNVVRTLTVSAPATAVATFRSTHALAADGSQDLLIPAGDGVPNLLKYAFNMLGSGEGQALDLATPNASVLTPDGAAGMPFSSLVPAPSSSLQVTFIRRKSATYPEITYTVEFSDTLASGSWAANASATVSVVSIDDTFERVTVTDSVTTPARRFVRVRVTVASP